MADGRRYSLTPQLDINQILVEAQHRWLRPAEICEILQNYKKFHIAPEPPNKPPSGSLFLFDRKVLRYFRKDGHNWRKKKDGKTVKEAHEKLKAGSVDVLHCYYAHGEGNESFQRRSYWLLEEEFMHIVLVHYLEVTGGKQSSCQTREAEEIGQSSNVDTPVCSSSYTSRSRLLSHSTDAGSQNSGQTSEYEDAESDNYQTGSRYHPFLEMLQHRDGPIVDPPLSSYVPVPSDKVISGYSEEIQHIARNSDYYSVDHQDITTAFEETGLGLTPSTSEAQLKLPSWNKVFEHCSDGFQSPFHTSVASTQASILEDDPSLQSLTCEGSYITSLTLEAAYAIGAEGKSQLQLGNMVEGSVVSAGNSIKSCRSIKESMGSYPLLKQSSLDLYKIESDGLKKYDSFSRWMSKELGEVDDLQMKPSSEAYWDAIETENIVEESSVPNHEQLDSYSVSPELSQDQLYSIIDFSPSWAYVGLETKVLISGTFLKNEDVEKYSWSCMFGEVEVPAEVLSDGALRCYSPPHKSGRVPFYVTCSNRLACSEVREFEYRETDAQYMEASEFPSVGINELHLQIRLEKLLTLGPVDREKLDFSCSKEKSELSSAINLLMGEDDEWSNLLEITEEEFLAENATNLLLEKLMKGKLHSWLLRKVNEDGKGPNVLGKEGQGVIHLSAALGYDWAIRPIITAGVNVNFRDIHGWTALHWAAFCGRERTVVALLSMGAAPGALADPSPDFPSGRTPADLASLNGHKGIAGFLAESSLTSHLSALTLKDSRGSSEEIHGLPAVENFAERSTVHLPGEDCQAESLKDSLVAVRNSVQVAARIYQVFRVQSFQRKKLVEDYGDAGSGTSDEHALSLLSVRSAKLGQHDMPQHTAAIRIQNKFRGWKGRKEFLVIRQRVVKIQAHVRGHQVRKRYRSIVWSVSMMEKVILRWRRKGSGLRGFRSKDLPEGCTAQSQPGKEDEYDVLKEGRKQTEAGLQKALSRVKSMVQYPEAREQYRRLLTVGTELQDLKAMQDGTTSVSETEDDDLMTGPEELYEDDMPMPVPGA